MPAIYRSTRLLVLALVVLTMTFPAAKPAAASAEPALASIGGTIRSSLLIDRYLYLGLPNRIVVLDTLNPDRLAPVSEVLIPGVATSFQLIDGRLYAGTVNGWVVLDVRPLAAPRYIGLFGRRASDKQTLFLPGGRAAVAVGPVGQVVRTVQILDLTNPAIPVQLGEVRVAEEIIRLAGDNNAVAIETGLPGLAVSYIYDLRAPEKPILQARLEQVQTALISGDYFYGFVVKNANFTVMVTYELQTFRRVRETPLYGTYPNVLTSKAQGVIELEYDLGRGETIQELFDLVDPANPRPLNIENPLVIAAGLDSVYNAAIINGIAYLLGGGTGLSRVVTLDVRQPDRIQRIGSLTFSGYARLGCAETRCLILLPDASGSRVNIIADLTDPSQPKPAEGFYDSGGFYGAASSDASRVYALRGTTLEIRRRSDLRLLGSYTFNCSNAFSDCYLAAVLVRDNLAYLGIEKSDGSRSLLAIVDLTYPSVPRLRSATPIVRSPADYPLPLRLVLSGGTLVYNVPYGGVALVNISNPDRPTARTLPDVVRSRIAVSGSTLFILKNPGSGQPELQVTDLTNPLNIPGPTALPSSAALGLSDLVGAQGDTVYGRLARGIVAISRNGKRRGTWSSPRGQQLGFAAEAGGSLLVGVDCTLYRLDVQGGAVPKTFGNLTIDPSWCGSGVLNVETFAVNGDHVRLAFPNWSGKTLASLQLAPTGGLTLRRIEATISFSAPLTGDDPPLMLVDSALVLGHGDSPPVSLPPPPLTVPIAPDGGNIDDGQVRAELGAGAFRAETPVTLRIGERTLPSAPGGLTFTGVVFNLSAPAGPSQPYTLTLRYTLPEAAGVFSGTLELRRWDGSAWVREPATTDQLARTLTVRPSALGWFALFGTGRRTLMPLLAAAR